MNSRDLDEILTLNTIPSILNRDTQGRLRKKMVVLKIENGSRGFCCSIWGVTPPNSTRFLLR